MKRASLLLAALALSASPAPAAEPPAYELVLNHIAVVNTADGSIRKDMTVAVAGGLIVAITPSGVATLKGRRTIDERGKYLVPGFWDMHAHPLDAEDPQGSLELMLANGITGFRQMSGSPALLEKRRTGDLMPSPDVPRLLAMPGQILTRANAGTPEAAIALVRSEKSEGADFIKAVDGTAATYLAAIGEARRQGLTFAGHLPPVFDVREASRAGMRSIEHLGPRDSIFLGCSRDEAALRASLPTSGPPSPPPQGPPSPAAAAMIARTLVNPILSTSPADFPRYQRVLDTLDDAKCDELASEFRANDTWQVPTLIRLRTMELAGDPAYRADPNLKYVPARTRRLWNEVTNAFVERMGPQRPALERLFRAQLDLVARFEKDRVPMMAGSDFGGGWVIAGFGLHQEFDLLALAGLTPLQVLQTTTRNGAEFLHLSESFGSVAVGKHADLVILDADPTASVSHLHAIFAVVRGGSYYSREALDDILKRIRERYATGAVE